MARTTEEEGGGGDEENSHRPSASSSSVPVRARPDRVLIVCRVFGAFTALAAILCIVVNTLSAIRSFQHRQDIFDGIFRCYAVLIAVFVVVAETEWGFIYKFWRILEYWAGRGMLQIFVAVMTRAYTYDSGQNRDLRLLQDIASYLLLACGLIYVISGLLCIGFLKRARQKKEITQEQAARDLKELEQRREELEALLITERS